MNKILRWIRNALIFFFTSTIISVIVLKWVPAYITPLMLIRCCEQMAHGEFPRMSHQWVPIERINHNLPQAVIASEDNLFLRHNGFDFEEIYRARLEALECKHHHTTDCKKHLFVARSQLDSQGLRGLFHRFD